MNALEATFSSVADASWRGACVILLMLAMRWCLRGRLPAQLMFWVWIAVALRLLLPVSVPASWSPFNLVSWRPSSADAPNPTVAVTTLGLADRPAIAAPAADSAPKGIVTSLASLSPAKWAGLIWCVGAGVLLSARILAGAILARRVRRTARLPTPAAIPRDVVQLLHEQRIVVTVTDAVSAPALHGILRPRILFPPGLIEALSPQELRLTIAHELAHARRRDLLADLLIHVATVMHWFNPVVWAAARAARHDCELACDEFVVRRANETERASYGATLLRLASISGQTPRAGFALGVISSKRQIKRRLQMIISNRAFTLPGTLLSGAVLTTLIAVSFTSDTTAQVGTTPTARPVPSADSSGIVYDSTVDRLDVLFPSGIVATVLDRSVTVADVRREVAPLIPHLKRDSRNQQEFNGRLAVLQNNAIKDLVNRIVLVRQFHDYRPGEQPKQISSESVEKYMEDTVNERFGGDRTKFLDHLRERNMTIRDYRKAAEEDIIHHYMRSQERKITGSTSPVRSDPAERPIRLRMIQLSRSVGDSDATLVAKAETILGRLRNGESFESLAREFDTSNRRERGGDWGWLGPADMRPQFRDTFMGLKKGDVSAPILTNEGCFLLYAEDRR